MAGMKKEEALTGSVVEKMYVQWFANFLACPSYTQCSVKGMEVSVTWSVTILYILTELQVMKFVILFR